MIVIAHSGHWLASLLYSAPIFVAATALGLRALRELRSHRKRTPGQGT
jgi:hypothetical protein